MENKNKKVTVIGLGQMGIKLAELLVSNGNEVTVWNRTPGKAKDLMHVSIAENISQALSASDIIVICVFDYNAVQAILAEIQDKTALNGKTIINFTTGNQQEAEELETWVNGYQGHYLDGAIQVAPDQMALPETTILISGNEQTYLEQSLLLKVFGGNIKYLGSKVSGASAMDLATLSWLYGSYVGLMYGAALAQSAGLQLSVFSEILGEITPGFTDFFRYELGVIDSDDFKITQSPLAISVSATERIAEAVKTAGLDQGFHDNIALLLRKAENNGLANSELAALINVVKEKQPETRAV